MMHPACTETYYRPALLGKRLGSSLLLIPPALKANSHAKPGANHLTWHQMISTPNYLGVY